MPGLLDIAQEAPATSLLQSSYLENLVNSYGIRKPYKSELEFFKKRPEVAGMATEDSKIILNPFSSNNPQEEQKSMFKGSEYETDEQSAKQSIIARFLTGDPSAGNVTKEQKDFADALKMKIK
jgi:hypothetical protein